METSNRYLTSAVMLLVALVLMMGLSLKKSDQESQAQPAAATATAAATPALQIVPTIENTRSSKQAMLPAELAEKTVSGMQVGDSGWIVSWGMFADQEGKLWLNGSYTLDKECGGTVCVLVTRLKKGYAVDLTQNPRYRWSKHSQPGYVGSFHPEPVFQLIRAHNVQHSTVGQCTLPSDLEEYTISRMKSGESGWIVPWGMFADQEGKLWLNGEYTVEPEPGGTVCMHVQKTERGYVVDTTSVPDDERKWSKDGHYVGDFHPEPVCELKQKAQAEKS